MAIQHAARKAARNRSSPLYRGKSGMEIVQNKALLLTVRNPHRITSTIPKSKVVEEKDGVFKVLVHYGLDEVQVLRNLGIKKVPSPILHRYKWPGIYKPFDHQRDTAAFLTMHRRSYCFSDPGTGKTAAIAWAADYLMNIGAIKRCLIICPLSIMSTAWQADLFRVLMHRTVDVAYGDRRKRAKIIQGNAEFVIINFDGVEVVQEELKTAGFGLVVIDEANAVKTATTKRWKAINSILSPSTWLWMATGTPASQAPTDAYGLAKMLNPSSVSPHFYGFRDTVMRKVTQFKWAPKPASKQIVFDLLQPAIRFAKDECLDLPELLFTTREAPLTPQQLQYYKILKDKFLMSAGGETVTSVNAATNINKLLQVSSGAVYTDDGNVIEFDITARYNILKEAIDESTHKVLVFIPFKHAITVLSERLHKDGYVAEIIDGGVPVHKRTDIFNRFQNDSGTRILLIQPAAASHGVTLHAANTVIWWGPVTSNEIYHQANARVHRQGQKNPCLVTRLVGSTVERKLYEALDSKSNDMTVLLDLYKDELK
jgi:SNF2 family DNA or RNA helicase